LSPGTTWGEEIATSQKGRKVEQTERGKYQKGENK